MTTHTTKLLAGSLLIGMGMAAGGAALAAVAAGVGVNWLGEGSAGLWSGLTAPPQEALGRAYAGAIGDGAAALKTEYRRTVDGRADGDAFDLVAAAAGEMAATEFPPGGADAEIAQRILAGALAGLLHGHDPRQVAFLQQELLPACAAAFQRRLLADETAWRAFHGLILQGLAANSAALLTRMDNFAQLLVGWSDPATGQEHLRRLETEIDALARQEPRPVVFDNQGMRVSGSVYQTTGNQYFGSAHAQGGGAATVINNFGGALPSSPPPQSQTATLLFLAANPLTTERLRVDEEARRVAESLRARGGRLVLAQEWAVRGEGLLDALLRARPAVLHFAGHAAAEGLLLEGADGHPALLTPEALAALLAATPGIRCVCLNACWSDDLVDALLGVVPCALGMDGAVEDRAAIAFAAGFYRVLGQGESVASALAGGQAQMLAEGLPPALTGQVRLRTVPGVDPSALRF
ncbi:MAG: CHAT domain-containing protein [Caldilineaceae bacterium]|nr:CHAT domain-containing protein [Caldilineaceae bacterium]